MFLDTEKIKTNLNRENTQEVERERERDRERGGWIGFNFCFQPQQIQVKEAHT